MERPPIPTLEQISAGGVAFRFADSEPEIAVVSVRPSRRWQLPKGLIDTGETEMQAAVGEVREEAGIDCEVLEKIETVEYWYYSTAKGEKVRFHKFVHFFLLRYIKGDTADHDHEIAEARWVSIEEAVEMLAFESEKEVVKKAGRAISSLSP